MEAAGFHRVEPDVELVICLSAASPPYLHVFFFFDWDLVRFVRSLEVGSSLMYLPDGYMDDSWAGIVSGLELGQWHKYR